VKCKSEKVIICTAKVQITTHTSTTQLLFDLLVLKRVLIYVVVSKTKEARFL